MSRAIQRYFWLVGVAAVVICGVLAAKAVNHVVEARYLGSTGPAAAPIAVVATSPREPVRERAGRQQRGVALADRNMFCSDCTLEEDRVPVEVAAVEGDAIPTTSLPLELVATNLASRAADSFATIRSSASGQQGSFWVGGTMPGGGPIEHIGGTYVTFHNPGTGRVEQISLLAQRGPPRDKVSPVTARAATGGFADKVEKIDDTTYRVDRSVITAVVTNPTQVGARIRPVGKDGEIEGFRVFAVRADSPLSAIGVHNGDTLHSINGFALSTSPEKMLELYTKLKDASSVSIELSRRGERVTMNYQVE